MQLKSSTVWPARSGGSHGAGTDRGIGKYVLRRIAQVIPSLAILSVVIFVFIHSIPGDPARLILGPTASNQEVEQVRASLGLNRPLWRQYPSWIWQLLHGNLGHSYLDNSSVSSDFFQRFPATVELSAVALLIAVFVGVPVGQWAARHLETNRDHAATAAALVLYSTPTFVVGLLLELVFGVWWKVLPVDGRLSTQYQIQPVTHFMLIDTLLNSQPAAFGDALKHLILPGLTLACIPTGFIMRMTRSAIRDVQDQDYVRTARAKGIVTRRIRRRHVRLNALPPIITLVGLQVGTLLSGAAITETVFSWNGVGSWAVQSINNHDYPVVEATILIFALIFLLVNLIADVCIALVNPKVTLGSAR